MSNSNHTAEISFANTLRKEAGSYIVPVLIVLAAIFISMGNLFSAKADQAHAPIISMSPSATETITVSGGSTGITVSGSSGATLGQ